MNLPLKGIIPPMITPLTKGGDLDIKGLKNLINHLLEGGVHGIFLLGTNGEAPSLPYKLRKELISEACKLVNKRVPVLVGITDTIFEGSIEIANHAKESGADAVVIAPPYYMPISQSEMVKYLENLVPKLPLPFIMYNMPSCTKMHLTIDTIKKAKELGAIGVKDSSGDAGYFYSLVEEFKDSPQFSLITGTEMFLPETIIYGGHGAVAGGGNFFPRLFVDLYEASVANDTDKIAVLREKVLKIYETIYSVGSYTSRYTKGTKSALRALGVCEDYMAMPLCNFGDEKRAKIKKYVEEFEYTNAN
ncbi:MAG: dihydrodipicolinate synthase family protein [Flavobacteriaceae bacterium]|nr:dihydrodipicolinate synthase family protein [Flavobacteriaceae bacterium]